VQQSVQSRYQRMSTALNATGRPILFSMCDWGVSSPWLYAQSVSRLCQSCHTSLAKLPECKCCNGIGCFLNLGDRAGGPLVEHVQTLSKLTGPPIDWAIDEILPKACLSSMEGCIRTQKKSIAVR